MKNQIEFTRITNDTNGNPRYVCHFLNFITQKDSEENPAMMVNATNVLYELAIKKAKKIGGRKYHTKAYGGGIVFQSYNIGDTEKAILNLVNS